LEHERGQRQRAETRCAEKLAAAQKLKKEANRKAKVAAKKELRLEKQIRNLKDGPSAKVPRSKLPLNMQQRLDAADADTVAAKERAEALEDELENLKVHIDVIRKEIGKGGDGMPNGLLLPDPALIEAAAVAAAEAIKAASAQ